MFTWVLGCFHSIVSAQTFRRALTASGGLLRGDKEWRNQFWQSGFEEGAVKSSECGLTQ